MSANGTIGEQALHAKNPFQCILLALDRLGGLSVFRFVIGVICILIYAGMYYAFDEILRTYDHSNGHYRKAGRRALMVVFWPFVYPEMILIERYKVWKSNGSLHGKSK